MANIIGTLTINQSKFVELDAHPMSSPTTGLAIGDHVVVDGIAGVWQKSGSGTYDFTRVDQLSGQSTQSTAAGTLSLASTSNAIQTFTGTAAGQLVNLPDATTIGPNTRFEFWNLSTQDVAVRDFGANGVVTVGAGSVSILVLADNTSQNGVWRSVSILPPTGGVSYGSPVALSPDSGNIDGTSSAVAHADHKHDLPAAAPTTTLSPATTSAEGTGTSVARNDHTHAVATALVADITTIQPDDAAAAGTANTFARGDHKHAIVTVTPSTIGTANAEGTATSFVRSDHVHAHGAQTNGTLHAVATTLVNGFMSSTDKTKLDASGILTSTAPVNVTKAAAAVGVSTETARADHKHDITTAAPATTLSPATTSTEGTATSIARSDHVHAVATALVADISTIQPDDAAAAGTANTFARGDHKHAIVAAAASTQNVDQANAEGTSTSFARADHVHNIPTAIAVSVGSANAQGSSTSASKADHVHQGIHALKATSAGTNRFGDLVLEQGTGITITDSGTGTFTWAAAAQTGTGLKTKNGIVAAGSFSGNPKTFAVLFSNFSYSNFANTNYVIKLSGGDARNWSWSSQATTGFTINANANTALTANVHWECTAIGETT